VYLIDFLCNKSLKKKKTVFNSGVLAYNVNSLTMVVAALKHVRIFTDCERTLEFGACRWQYLDK